MHKTPATNPRRSRRTARRLGRTVAAATIAAAATVALAAGPASATPIDVPSQPGGPVAGVVQGAVAAVTQAPPVPTAHTTSNGITVLSVTQEGERRYSLQLTSDAFGKTPSGAVQSVNVQVVVHPRTTSRPTPRTHTPRCT